MFQTNSVKLKNRVLPTTYTYMNISFNLLLAISLINVDFHRLQSRQMKITNINERLLFLEISIICLLCFSFNCFTNQTRFVGDVWVFYWLFFFEKCLHLSSRSSLHFARDNRLQVPETSQLLFVIKGKIRIVRSISLSLKRRKIFKKFNKNWVFKCLKKLFELNLKLELLKLNKNCA